MLSDDNLAMLGRAACEDLDLIRCVDNVVPVDIQTRSHQAATHRAEQGYV